MDCYIFFTRCNDFNFCVCRTIVVYRPEITNRRVECYKVLNAVCITTADYIRRDIVTTLAYPCRNTLDGLFGCRQPKVE